MVRIFGIIVLVLFLSAESNATTPIISNVSGTVATGNLLTITGTNMVNENTSGWLGSSYWPGVTPKDNAYMTGQSGNIPEQNATPGIWYYGTTGDGVYDSTNKVMSGSVSAKVTARQQCTLGTSCGGSRIDIINQNRPANVYYSSYIKFSGNFATQYQKFFLTGPNSQFYLDAGVNGDGTATGFAIKDGSWGDSWTKYGSVPWTKDTWHYWELEVDTTHYSGDRFTVWWDGIQSFQYTFPGHSGAGTWYAEHGIPNWSNQTGAPTQTAFNMWINRYVSSSSRIYPASTIELSLDGTNWKWQEPLSLSDTAIQVKVDTSGLSGSSPRIRITNNLLQTSSTYNISGTGDTTNPSVTITSPTNNTTYSTTSTPLTSLAGISSDNVSVASVTWTCPTCTPNSGTATGTTAWSVSSIGLATGTNNITVTSTDTSSNTATDTLAVTYTSSVVNGACGSSSGGYFSTLTSASPNLCGSGTVASFTGSGPWTWGCNGLNGGTSTSSTSCHASLSSSTALFSESFDDSSFGSRDWYDAYPSSVVSSGCYLGSCVQFSFTSGGTNPTSMPAGAMRKKFTPTDSLYLSYWIKFNTGWRGSQQTYHPHIILISSDLDPDYSPLANNYLNTYVEFISDIGSPYAIRPAMAIQDQKRVNTSNGTPPNNLSSITENRSVAYCNTPVGPGSTGICYADDPYYSANLWIDSSTSLSMNTWHHVEVYFHMNSIVGSVGQHDGTMQEWIDGVQSINHSDVLYRTNQDATKKWAQFVIAPYIGDGSPIAQSFMMDELTVATGLPQVVIPTLRANGLRGGIKSGAIITQ